MMTPWGAVGLGAAAAMKGWRDREREVQAKTERDREFDLRKREADTREEVVRRNMAKESAETLASGIDPAEEHYTGIFGADGPLADQFPDVNNNGIDDRLEGAQAQTAGGAAGMPGQAGAQPVGFAPGHGASAAHGGAAGGQALAPDAWYKQSSDRTWAIGNKMLAARNKALEAVKGDDEAAAMKRAAIVQRYAPLLKTTLDAYDSSVKQANEARLLRLRGSMAEIALSATSGDEIIQRGGPILQALGIPAETFAGAVRTTDANGQEGWKMANGSFRPLSEMAAVIDQTRAMEALAKREQVEAEARKGKQKEKEIKLQGDQNVRSATAAQHASFALQGQEIERSAKALADATGAKPGSPEYDEALRAGRAVIAMKIPGTAVIGGGVDMKKMRLYADLGSEAAKIAALDTDDAAKLRALSILESKAAGLGLPSPFRVVRDPKTGKITDIEQTDPNQSAGAFMRPGFTNPLARQATAPKPGASKKAASLIGGN